MQYYDSFRLSPEMEQKYGMTYVPLEMLIETSDIVTLHVPLLDSTRHMLGAEEIARMKKDAVIITQPGAAGG